MANNGRGAPKIWTEEAIVLAIQLWHELYGEPPRMIDWQGTFPAGFPWDTTVVSTFGNWGNAIEAAGFPRPRPGRRVLTDALAKSQLRREQRARQKV